MDSLSTLEKAYGVLTVLVAHTPDVTRWQAVAAVWHALLPLSAWTVVLGFAFVVLEDWYHGRPHDVMRLAFRLMFPVALSLFSFTLCSVGIEFLNAALALVAQGVEPPPPPSFTRLGLVALLLWLPWLLSALLLALTYLVRLGELALLSAVSGLALASLATPFEAFGRRWVGLFTAQLITQFLQAISLLLARALAGLLGSSPPDLMLLSVVLLVIVWRLPALFPSLVQDRLATFLVGVVRAFS